MKTLILIFTLLISDLILAQAATPTYTDYLRLRKYAQGDNPSADSLNANWTGVDTWADGVAELDSANTYSARQTYSNGATFSAASYGTVTFADTVASSHAMTGKLYLPYDATSQVGIPSAPMFRVHTRDIRLYNTELNDSSIISYDDSTLTIDKQTNITDLVVTSSIDVDSAVGFVSFNLQLSDIEISDVGDSVISVGQRRSHISLGLPGDMQEGFETLNISGFSVGDMVIIYTTDATDTCFFIDIDVGDADCNMDLAGNFNMSANDNLALLCVSVAEGVANWIELWRKDN